MIQTIPAAVPVTDRPALRTLRKKTTPNPSRLREGSSSATTLQDASLPSRRREGGETW
ncbi:hypothetical protein GCM10011494_09220 [Novosphingobium endophyticum]|uniref:Uncharacterized protein n=1 Tax=Novosphingobium endophyticum TaxID=1955250 RepID=A0A916TQC9_9SPHN|nr:hypothetical protein GCM10011494_09220 [Novosphingobium endophyticum]